MLIDLKIKEFGGCGVENFQETNLVLKSFDRLNNGCKVVQ